MKRRALAITVGTALLLGGSLWGVAKRGSALDVAASPDASAALLAADVEARDREIELFERRAAEDEWSAGDRAWLASLLLQRSRETGSHHDVVRAEELARRALELRTVRNHESWAVLSASLLEQHRFREAQEAAERLTEAEPENVAFRAHLAEIELELGEYELAGTRFTSLEPFRDNLDVAPRLARWKELNGRPDEARALLYVARQRASARVNMPREQLAWFHLRVGDLELRHGRFREAEKAFQGGLALVPDDYRLLAGMARLEAARQNWTASIEYAERVMGTLLDPSTLALMSDVYAAMGEPEKAEEYATVMAIAVESQETEFHRDWALFLLDRGTKMEEVLARAERELATRRDIYTNDAYAWALFRAGRFDEAGRQMERTLRLGTEDALLLYHAGMIARAEGHPDRAEKQLKRSLKINPRFHPAHVRSARATLDSLRAEKPWSRRLGL